MSNLMSASVVTFAFKYIIHWKTDDPLYSNWQVANFRWHENSEIITILGAKTAFSSGKKVEIGAIVRQILPENFRKKH